MNVDAIDHARQTQQSYDLVAGEYQTRNGDRSVLRPRFTRFQQLLAPEARVLDLGAGPCADAAELSALGLRVVAVDRSAEMLRLGRARFAGPRVRADLRALTFADARFDGAWANASLLHLRREELLPALAGVRRVLRPSGVLYASLKQGDGERWDRASYGPKTPRWFTYYRDPELDAALDAAGFDLIESHTEGTVKETWLVRFARARG
ncbi:MAG TPA: class I SAM-dependent methyltransferase [Polyangiales bacterium]|nr:class I SAM-dependent methyltransferase [Polyangiales bacterium]